MFRFSVARVCRALGILAPGIVVVLGGSWTFGADTPTCALQAIRDVASGQIDIVEGGRPVLRYNYHTVQPPKGFLERVRPDSRKYALPRSDYIHPLFGLDGETLTADWDKGEPHHRGIYWAWPEVDYRGQRGDLHALQNVFARPTGRINLHTAADRSEIEAENVWKWKDQTPIVRETAVLRVWPSGQHGRFIDLVLTFQAIEDDVALARRETKLYGGLNVRLSPVKELKISTHTAPADAKLRSSWGVASGIWPSGNRPAGLAVFPHLSNPEYPAQWIEYADLPWFQPTFPTAMTRYVLKKGQPLKLQYRLWIHRDGKLPDAIYDQQWSAYK